MATTQNTFTGNGTNVGPFSFTFKWLKDTDIYVSVNSVIKILGTDYTFSSPLNYTTKTGGSITFATAPANGASIRIFRQTSNDNPVATFASGSAIRAKDLNDNTTQVLYASQENTNYSVQDIGNVTLAANYAFAGTASGLTPTSNNHFATKGYVDGVAFASGNLTTGDKGDITVNSASSWTIDANAVTTAKISNGAVTAAKLDTTYLTSADLSSYLTSATAASTYLPVYTTTTTATSKTLANRERCTVTAAGQTITLPPTPTAGNEVAVGVLNFTNTTIARNGSNIMSLAEDMTLNTANATVTFLYVDATRGWRII